MGMPVDLLAQEVLQLSTSERTTLLNRVIASLDADAEQDEAWDQLAAERDAHANADSSLLINGNEFLAALKTQLK
jgi:hypothetical protein